jgi:hypothetical protein
MTGAPGPVGHAAGTEGHAAGPEVGGGRIPALDGLRACAILLVVAAHTTKPQNTPLGAAGHPELQLAVEPSPGEVAPPRGELTPWSGLDDPASVEDDDSVGLSQRSGLARRADDGRPARAQRGPELDLCRRVERRGHVVGQQQVSLTRERSREGQPLHLATGQPDPAVADERVGSAGLGNVPLHPSPSERWPDLSVGVVEGDVAGERPGQDPRHLGDVGDPSGSQLDLRLGQSAAVPDHLARVRGKPGQ